MIRAFLLVGVLAFGFLTYALAGAIGWGLVGLFRRLVGDATPVDRSSVLIAAGCGFAGGWVGLLALFTADAIHHDVADGPAFLACWIVAIGAGAASRLLTDGRT